MSQKLQAIFETLFVSKLRHHRCRLKVDTCKIFTWVTRISRALVKIFASENFQRAAKLREHAQARALGRDFFKNFARAKFSARVCADSQGPAGLRNAGPQLASAQNFSQAKNFSRTRKNKFCKQNLFLFNFFCAGLRRCCKALPQGGFGSLIPQVEFYSIIAPTTKE